MRLVFAGTPEVALPSFDAVLASRHEVVAVLTRPDARAGRGRTLHPSPVKEAALAAGVEVFTPERPRDPAFVDRLREMAPDACPIVAYGGLIPPEVLAIPRHGWVNLHFSLLPAWRGAAPVQHAVIAGDDRTGASTFLLEEGLDTGPVLDTLTEPIGPADTSGDLLARLALRGGGLLVSSLDALESGEAVPTPQSQTGVGLAPKLTVDDARIRWADSAVAVSARIRGCTPAPGAWTTFRGERLKVIAAEVLAVGDDAGSADDDVDAAAGGRPGPGRLRVTKRAVDVGTADGLLRLTTVQPHGKKAMAAPDWARGARVGDDEEFAA